MAKGIKKRLDKATEAARKEIADSTDRGNLYSRGLSGEGWTGGYLQALQDVRLILNGTEPSTRFWHRD